MLWRWIAETAAISKLIKEQIILINTGIICYGAIPLTERGGLYIRFTLIMLQVLDAGVVALFPDGIIFSLWYSFER